MTIEQNRRCAISYLNELKASTSGYSVEWLDMAIKALEQQPCEDCISRTELLARIDAERKHLLDIKMDGAEHIIVHHARRIIEDMPSVTPQHTRWIPVSERLPDKSGKYWCTFGGTNLTGSDYYTTESEAKKLFENPGKYVGWQSQNVLAWMPLPEPYTESEE